ncbi:MAG: SUMF1/EgtB/PvdO family nonheme iron enzyme [Polyangiaceae bacterium]|nr:SUMF1/EgtB/PvdO family nonheme iron enzyme [Polyangiaceae bacterium]
MEVEKPAQEHLDGPVCVARFAYFVRRLCQSHWRSQTLLLGALLVGCSGDNADPAGDAGQGSSGSTSTFISDAGSDAEADAAPAPTVEKPREKICPPEMVRVAHRYCIDRFEATLHDSGTGETISPYYAPSKKLALLAERTWEKERLNVGDPDDQQMVLPILPAWEKQRDFEPRAVSKKGSLPNGYTTGKLAETACRNAGKRLCTLEEWRTACRGEDDRPFPYGDKYEQGKCNIFREGHPAMELHNDASRGHSDPRLNQVKINGKPLLRRTGETATCASRWEGDAVYDMVGNLDEWIDDPEGTFVGGFFSRSKKDGCASIITAHPFDYFDYSTGVRCCAELRPAPVP